MTRLHVRRLASAGALASLAAAAFLAGCGRPARQQAPSRALDVEVWSDTSGSFPLRVEAPPAARVWLRSVAITRPAAVEAPLPVADPGTVPPDTAPPPGLVIDPGLKAPILKSRARLVLPRGRARAGVVELDVRVSEEGDVTDARRAGGDTEPARVAAAIACARSMTFHPALLAGRPVTVWCRQRFEFPER